MMSTTFAVVLFTLCLATGLQASTPYTSCSTPADPIDFRMDGCTESPCYLYRGETANAEWDFEVTADTAKLTPRVKATVFSIITITYDIGQENACDTLTNAECPLDKGEEITYALSMPVLASYPKLSLTIEFALVDDNDDAQVCFKIAATVADRTSSFNLNNTYNGICTHIHAAAKKVYEFCCKKAVEEEKKENEKRERPTLNLKVSGDGTWKKRGFKSLYGVTTLIGYYSGKVIGLVVRSSYCQSCIVYWKNKSKNSAEYLAWKDDHDEENCMKAHEGSAGNMEVESVKMMFLRSEELYGVKYGNYIGDGDSKTFTAVVNLNPYGDELTVVNSECIDHVQERMGTRLRNIRETKKLGGKGKLTEALVEKLRT